MNINLLLCARFGRRPNLVGHYVVGGLLCMATAAVPLGKVGRYTISTISTLRCIYNIYTASTISTQYQYPHEWPIVGLAMAGKYITAVCWGIVYTYTNELFPTVVR